MSRSFFVHLAKGACTREIMHLSNTGFQNVVLLNISLSIFFFRLRWLVFLKTFLS